MHLYYYEIVHQLGKLSSSGVGLTWDIILRSKLSSDAFACTLENETTAEDRRPNVQRPQGQDLYLSASTYMSIKRPKSWLDSIGVVSYSDMVSQCSVYRSCQLVAAYISVVIAWLHPRRHSKGVSMSVLVGTDQAQIVTCLDAQTSHLPKSWRALRGSKQRSCSDPLCARLLVCLYFAALVLASRACIVLHYKKLAWYVLYGNCQDKYLEEMTVYSY